MKCYDYYFNFPVHSSWDRILEKRPIARGWTWGIPVAGRGRWRQVQVLDGAPGAQVLLVLAFETWGCSAAVGVGPRGSHGESRPAFQAASSPGPAFSTLTLSWRWWLVSLKSARCVILSFFGMKLQEHGMEVGPLWAPDPWGKVKH